MLAKISVPDNRSGDIWNKGRNFLWSHLFCIFVSFSQIVSWSHLKLFSNALDTHVILPYIYFVGHTYVSNYLIAFEETENLFKYSIQDTYIKDSNKIYYVCLYMLGTITTTIAYQFFWISRNFHNYLTSYRTGSTALPKDKLTNNSVCIFVFKYQDR